MEGAAESLINVYAQCWTCPVFDSLFNVISNTAAAAYQRLTLFSVIIFCVLIAFYILNAVWENVKSGNADPFFQKTLKPVLIKSLIALTLLSAGLIVPRLISKITFEPVAQITLEFAKSMLPENHIVSTGYSPITLSDNGFFTTKLRDTLLQLIETSIANFQVYIQVGINIMNEAFSIKALLGVGALIRHIIVCFIGMFLTYKFAVLFIKYSWCFMDIIIAMALFAFLFPLSLVLFIFKDANSAPSWMKSLGKSLGGGQIKKLINAIVSVSATILTYTIIMLIINGFLNNNGATTATLQGSTKDLFSLDLENSSAMQMTVAGAIVLVYVINYIADQIPEITKKILSTFGLSQEDSLSKEMGENAWKFTTLVAKQTKDFAKAVINPESVTKKDDTKEEKKK